MKTLIVVALVFAVSYSRGEPITPRGYDFRAGNKEGVRFKRSVGGDKKLRRLKTALFIGVSLGLAYVEIVNPKNIFL